MLDRHGLVVRRKFRRRVPPGPSSLAAIGAGLATAVYGNASLYLRYDGHALTAGFRVNW